MNDDQNTSGLYLPPGTAVRYDGLEEDGPEHGTVVHCWLDHEIGAHDCYVAFFGDKQPMGELSENPYILSYASTSLTVIHTAAD